MTSPLSASSADRPQSHTVSDLDSNVSIVTTEKQKKSSADAEEQVENRFSRIFQLIKSRTRMTHLREVTTKLASEKQNDIIAIDLQIKELENERSLLKKEKTQLGKQKSQCSGRTKKSLTKKLALKTEQQNKLLLQIENLRKEKKKLEKTYSEYRSMLHKISLDLARIKKETESLEVQFQQLEASIPQQKKTPPIHTNETVQGSNEAKSFIFKID